MSRMLQALKNLSSRSARPAEEPVAPIADERPVAAPPDPVLPPAEHGRRMQELLVKHLSSPLPMAPRAADSAAPIASEATGGMTLPMPSLRAPPLSAAGQPSLAMSFLSDDDGESENVRESVEVCLAEPPQQGAGRHETVSIVSVGAVARLLASLEEISENAEEEVALSFVDEREQNSENGEQQEESREQRAEVREQQSEVEQPVPPLCPLPSITPSPPPSVTPPLPLSLTPSPPHPLDHLADARPLAANVPEEVQPAPAPRALPPRSISRGKTRLEQRVLDNLSHPSNCLPYRELAERLRLDLRLLTGRCLLFTGIGPASHADNLLPHLASLLADDDAELLMVDADATRAGLTVGFGALKETGLGELPDRSRPSHELVLPTLLANVSLLPAGRKALPSSIDVVDQVAELLAQLEERYSLVLIDGGAHTGALVPALARLCDATYFVVRLGATDARAATTAVQTFRANGARILGCVATCGATSK